MHLAADFCAEALREALSKGKPEVFNTDQGSQFTDEAFRGLLERDGVRVGMDGKQLYSDNIFVERQWRTVKYEEVYLKASSETGSQGWARCLLQLLQQSETHQAFGYKTPAEVFNDDLAASTQHPEEGRRTPDRESVSNPDATGLSLNRAPMLFK